MLSMTLLDSYSMQRIVSNAIGLTVVVLAIGPACVSCVSGDRHAVHAPVRSTTHLSLQVPSLGAPVFPHEVPYAKNTPSRSAYLQGFATGWQIIQDAGRGSLVVAPQEYAAPPEVHDAWENGVRDGKEAAYGSYQRQSTASSPDKDHDDDVLP